MSLAAIHTDELAWEPPGPGSWVSDRSHKLTSLTRPMQDVFGPAFEAGFREVCARYGLPLETIRTRYVNGYGYSQARPLGVPDKALASSPPPFLTLWAMSRLHPELRRRNRQAKVAFAQRQWREDATVWRNATMPERVAANRRLQAVDVAGLDDDSLVHHVRTCADLATSGFRHHFSTVGVALAVGDLLASGERWGVDAGELVALLAGASPASSDGRDRLRRIAAELPARSAPPQTLAEVWGASDVAAAELDAYLGLYGARLIGSSDLDGTTLGELPSVILRALGAAGRPAASETAGPDEEAVRAKVPAGQRRRFDELLTEARLAYGVREEEVGVSASWPMGLLRLALLEAGWRLAAQGALAERDHVFDLAVDEVAGLLADGFGPTRDDVAARRRRREVADRSEPATHLGTTPAPLPPPSAFPRSMARALRAVSAYSSRLAAAPAGVPLRGVGVGARRYCGTACVAASAEEALDRLQPGQVLVTSITTPAFNTVLALAGALVTQEGGLLSHPAIAARELDVPAVVGAPGVLDIPDGADVIVDPIAGLVALAQGPPRW